MSDTISLDDLPIGPDDHEGDPGCDWHPRPDKGEVRDADGNLCDLDDDQVTEHTEKPESDEQYDGVRRRARQDRELGAAEDSDHSEPGEV